MLRRPLAWLATLAALTVALQHWADRECAQVGSDVVVFSSARAGCPIVLPAHAIEVERQAALLVQETLAQASGRARSDFPILIESRAAPVRAIFVGGTRASLTFGRPSRSPHDNAVFLAVRGGGVYVRSERREAVEAAASWFLETHLGAHWFMPGPLGAHVPRREALSLRAGLTAARPGFISRDLGVAGEVDAEWHRRNRLEARFEHAHNLVNIFRPADLARQPEMAPLRQGVRHIPTAGYNWQPNFLSSAAVDHATAAALNAFRAAPHRVSFSLSENDSYRFDDSPATLAAVAPARFFRHRPDYSDLVFRFSNEVAARVAKRFPDRYLPTYAYYWTENTPRFPVARTVVPFLTADRSLWAYPEFAAEDRALIERWCRSGAEFVGLYDYFYGAPFLVPRPTLYAVAESIPFAHRAGVRIFNAEMTPNWALDGPKPWLAAQLLWSPERDPQELLAIYYRDFWGAAAAPMRAFFGECDDAWRALRDEPRWIRYYEDDDQVRIFPPERIARLRSHLEEAARLARSPLIQARVRMASAGFGVTEAFARFGRARERAATRATTAAEPRELAADWAELRAARGEFMERWKDTRETEPLAIGMREAEIYLRNSPDGRVAGALAATGAGRDVLRAMPEVTLRTLGASPREIEELLAHGVERLSDPQWRDVSRGAIDTSTAIDWMRPGRPWRGYGEPWERRSVTLEPGPDRVPVLRLSGVRYEQVNQWLPAKGNSLYVARLKVRGKSSPGTEVSLLLSFIDAQQKHIGLGERDRLVASERVSEGELIVIRRAPPNAAFVGVGVLVQNQIHDDFVELKGVSLRQLVE